MVGAGMSAPISRPYFEGFARCGCAPTLDESASPSHLQGSCAPFQSASARGRSPARAASACPRSPSRKGLPRRFAQIGGLRGRVAVICGGRTQRFEELPPRSKRRRYPRQLGIFAGQRTKSFSSRNPANSGSTTESGRNVGRIASFPPRLANRRVIGKRVQRRIGGCQYFNFESLVQGARQKRRRGQLRLNRVVIVVGVRRREPLVQPEQFLKAKSSQSREGVPRNR